MSTAFYHAALVLHIIGITMMAGTAFIDFITFRAFSKAYSTDEGKSLVLADYLNLLQRFLGIGMLLILVSGIAMMARLHEVWGAQLWFRIKMILLLLAIINGLGLRRALGNKLKKITTNRPSVSSNERWYNIRRNFTLIQAVQLLLFIIIYTLSIFKFN